jgi:RNA polymerase sigma factor (sigma-70 family)
MWLLQGHIRSCGATGFKIFSKDGFDDCTRARFNAAAIHAFPLPAFRPIPLPLPPDDNHNAQLHSWLAATARGDGAAFRRLYEATAPKLFGLALRILSKREWAEEVLQESFVNVWNSAESYESGRAAPMTWMSTIVRNKAFDFLRRRDETVEIDAETFDKEVMAALESQDPTPLERLQLSAQASALAGCLGHLQGLHRQAIALAFFHDLSHSEVAQQMQLPIGTVKTWIRRGMDRLRECMAKWEGR